LLKRETGHPLATTVVQPCESGGYFSARRAEKKIADRIQVLAELRKSRLRKPGDVVVTARKYIVHVHFVMM